MAVPILPRHWGEILTLASLLFVLIVTLVTGLLLEECGKNRVCGYGTRCEGDRECVCLSDSHVRVKRNGTPNSMVYCFGAGVRECGEKVCGYRAHCNTANKACECSSNNIVQKNLKDTPLWYCVESCTPAPNSNCPDNTTCMDPQGVKRYRCYCSAGAALSSTGQCLGKDTPTLTPSAVPVFSKGTNSSRGITLKGGVTLKKGDRSNNQGNDKEEDSQTLIIGLVAGVGGAVLLAVVVLVVGVLARKRRKKRGNGSEIDSLRRQPQPPHQLKASNSQAYESVVDPVPRGPSGTDKSDGPTVLVQAEFSVISPASWPGAYEDVENDFSLHTISANKGQQREKNNLQEQSEPNQYNTLYDLTQANGNGCGLQPKKTGSWNTDEATADYSATYSTAGSREGNPQPAGNAPRGDNEYDELKRPKV